MQNILLFESFNLLNESISSARKRFLETGKITPEQFEEAQVLDPTKTKKYLEKIIEFMLDGVSKEQIQANIEKFEILASKGVIKNKDINSYTFDNLQTTINQLQNIKTKTSQKKDADVVFENETYLVVSPNTYEASCAYGDRAKWCTADPKEDSHWNMYWDKGIKLYYIIDKTKTREQYKDTEDPTRDQTFKMAVAVHPDGKTFECFLGNDDRIRFEKVLEITGLDKELFKPVNEEEIKVRRKEQLKRKFKQELLIDNGDGTWDYDGDLDLSNVYLKSLKDLPYKFRKVSGDFDCSNNKLTSLEFAPVEVDGDFNCYTNSLTSLEFAPQVVNGDFVCSDNNLTSLKFAPQIVNEVFNCSDNNLTSLEGSPREVGEDFNCSYNKLTSLKDSPRKVGRSFYCEYNTLFSLEGSPVKIEGTFNCSKNNLTSLKFAPQEVKWDFFCFHNKLTSLEFAPQKVGEDFNCVQNFLPLEEIEKLKQRVDYEIIFQSQREQ